MTEKLGMKTIDDKLLAAIAKSQGPAIFREDAKRVSCGDKVELARVKNNFLIKKLGMKDGPNLDAAIKKVCETFGSSNRNKYRVIFYYLLTKNLRKSSVFNS
ncbi:MAG: DUF2853 family protein [Ignavibacteriales bacterium]|nr:DUF2853 family protein [Ignavibacteriales bacterium]